MFCENTSAIAIARDPMVTKKTSHVQFEIQFHLSKIGIWKYTH